MLTNYHTHTIFCDGNNTPEEVVLSAINKGFDAIGFSGHCYTDFDLTYCMKDMQKYSDTITSLKKKFEGKIQIYHGVEEDMYCPSDRKNFDYIIGSCHYFNIDGSYYPIDSNHETFKECVKAFGGDLMKLADSYYQAFCDYILKRKPDIVGHFDLITKFDELDGLLMLNNPEYQKKAELYMEKALKSDCIFEVNTGAISRGYRTTPYPSVELLYYMKKHNAKLILSSDSHSIEALDCEFSTTKEFLRDIGFKHLYHLYNNEFIKEDI